MKKFLLGLVALILIYAAAAFSFHLPPFSSNDTQKQGSLHVLKVGIMAGSKQEDEKWKIISKNAKKLGIKLKFTRFTDYSQPNAALQNGDTDVNSFQHYAFLSNWNKENKGTLVAVGETVLGPGRLYSGVDASGKDKYSKVSQIPDGATVAIANDVTNEARALFLLRAAGLIKLNDNENPALKDITDNPHNFKFKEVAADQTLPALKDVDAAVISAAYVDAAGKDINSAIYVWTANNKDTHQWVNIIAAQSKDKNDKYVKAFVKAYQSDNVANYINDTEKGAEIAAWKGAPQPKETKNN
ncbi:MAG: methionine ABC transporter substrate-binding protein [Lactobacillaceae bacterium]|jgi:D-methionine transport system substrate-binding protein|nr:methionine ABC transporter substrate-binding protein [Lactobacillaceae bacterium]